MTIYVTRGQSPMRIPLKLPATPADIGEAFAVRQVALSVLY